MTAEARLARIVRVRPAELPALLWSFGYFFCLLAAYYVVRPVRDEMGVQVGAERLKWLFSAVFLTMLALIPIFGWLSARLPVTRLLPTVYGFFVLNLLVFRVLLGGFASLRAVAPAFFVWVSVFNLFAVSVFWSFMADLFEPDAAQRLFGFISAGGSLGAVTAPLLTAWLAPVIGIPNLIAVSACLLALSLICIVRLLRLRTGLPGLDREARAPARPSVWEGVRRITRSPYLGGICVFLLCYTLLSTMLYFMQTAIVPKVIVTPEQRTRLFASVDWVVNVLALLLQFFATGRLLSRLGVTLMLAALPVLSIAGFAVLGVFTVLPVLIAFGVLRRAGEFAISKPTRETLFTVVPREEKYQAKNVIDTVVHRGGDTASGWAASGLLGLGLPVMAFAGVPIALLWLFTALYLGRRHEQLRAAHAGE